jgi:hypothetical protein
MYSGFFFASFVPCFCSYFYGDSGGNSVGRIGWAWCEKQEQTPIRTCHHVTSRLWRRRRRLVVAMLVTGIGFVFVSVCVLRLLPATSDAGGE